MSEQRCLDCDTREAAGGYCTLCLGTNIALEKSGRGRPASVTGAAPRNAQKGGRKRPAARGGVPA